MNRRDFLTALGFGTVGLALDPSIVLTSSSSLQIATEYPVPYITPFKKSATQPIVAAQLLWNVLYEHAKTRETKLVYWCQNATFEADCIRWRDGELEPMSLVYVRSRLTNSFMSYVHLMDGIIEKAHRGFVEDPEFTRAIRNPEYDPQHKATHDLSTEDGEDEYHYYCNKCRAVDSERVDQPLKRFRLINAWDAKPSTGERQVSDPAWMWDVKESEFKPIQIESIVAELAKLFGQQGIACAYQSKPEVA